jgi:hypothetical protein
MKELQAFILIGFAVFGTLYAVFPPRHDYFVRYHSIDTNGVVITTQHVYDRTRLTLKLLKQIRTDGQHGDTNITVWVENVIRLDNL